MARVVRSLDKNGTLTYKTETTLLDEITPDSNLVAAETIKFPTNLKKIGNYLQINIYDYVFNFSLRAARGNKKQTLLLPLPNSLATDYSQNYTPQSIGIAGASAAEGAGKAITAALGAGKMSTENFLESLKSEAETAVKNTGIEGIGAFALDIGRSDLLPLLGEALNFTGLPGVGAAIGAAGQNVVTAGLAEVGMARNPHMAVLYESPNFRVFNFTFDLKPKTEEDSVALFNIIYNLKYYSAPEYSEKRHFFKYPQQFGLKVRHDSFLFRYNLCALNNVQVEYHGEGTPLYYNFIKNKGNTQDITGSGGIGVRRKDPVSEKAPAAVTLTLTFTELRVLTKTEISQGS